MKMMRPRSGPFKERPYYEDAEIEAIVTDELRNVDLMPATPGPIRVERFIEKRFGIVPEYNDVPSGILGFTKFGTKGPEAVVVSGALSEEGTRVAERRINSTLAHEAGHMLLHGHLFALERRDGSQRLFQDELNEKQQTILCRTSTVGSQPDYRYDGRWWEFQANKVIGALLLPSLLVNEALDSVLVSQGSLGVRVLDDASREVAVHKLVDFFDVNPIVARIRTGELFPSTAHGQLYL